MPLIIIVILAVLIAQIGFWDTFGAIFGGAAMIFLFLLLLIALLGLAGALALRRLRRR